MTRVTIENLVRSYGKLTVLKDVSLDIKEGEFVVLLGPSGCGKSTLMAAIAGLDEVQGGRILFDDRDVTKLEPSEREIGMVFQSYALYPTMTARANMAFALRVAGASKAEINERVTWAAQLCQIEHLLDRKPGELSGGQRQRVAIGRALVRKARLFLFDEPLSNLDAKLRTEMRAEIKSLHERLGATFIFVTHDQIEAMTLATRIAVMDRGVIQQIGTPDDIYRRPQTRFVADFVGSPAMSFLEGNLTVDQGRPAIHLGDHKIDLATYEFAAPFTGEPRMVTFGIRPERIEVHPQPVAKSIIARLKGREPMGADTLLWLDLGGLRLSARVPPEVGPMLHDTVHITFDPVGISVFDTETGQRV